MDALRLVTLGTMRAYTSQAMLKKSFVLSALLACTSIYSNAETGLNLAWTNNLLTVSGPTLPGGRLEILYLEAFCHKGLTARRWDKTVLLHETKLISAEPKHLLFRTSIEPNAVMIHEVRAGADSIDFQFALTNEGN